MIIGVFLFLTIVMFASFATGPFLSVLAFAQYVLFAKRVKEIANSDLSSDEMGEALNQAAFLVVIGMIVAMLPIFNILGPAGASLSIMLASWVLLFKVDSSTY